MCGICGFVESAPRSADALADFADAMARTLHHRGPDGRGTWVDAATGVALGHARLSVVDLSDGGAQPMHSACGRYVITYNGEIYDFRDLRRELETLGHAFRGHSDTEVLLEAIATWGFEGALQRIDGMFAFALWDRETRRLRLVRDRIGKKPLYWAQSNDRLRFGSELKALAASPGFSPEVDRDALGFFVRYSYVPAPFTIYKDVRKLVPGSWVEFAVDAGVRKCREQVYWSAREAVECGLRDPFPGAPEDAVEELDLRLRNAVARRLVADVPLGALLSGGIDSSAVVAAMRAVATSPVRTFSIGYGERDHDEAHHARRIADHLGTEHRELRVTPDTARAVIPRLSTLYDEPCADTSQLPTVLVCELARREVTVALSGDGGDELFAGYERYFRVLRRWRRLAALPASLRRNLSAIALGIAPARLEKVADALAAESVLDLFARGNARHPAAMRLVPDAAPLPALLHTPDGWPRSDEPLTAMMGIDLAGRLPESILVKVDRASMGVSLEVRSPLLDRRVVELATRLPAALQVREGRPKWVLRQVLERSVPRSLFERPKMGFGVPIGAWLRGPLRAWGEELLDPQRLREDGLLDPNAVRTLWDQHQRGVRDRRFLLWNLLSFEAWRRSPLAIGS